MNKKISELPIMANEIQDEDILAMVDVSDMTTKKVGVGILRDTVAPDITITAQIDGTTGTPSVSVTESGTPREPEYELEFSGLKGEPGNDGEDGVSVESIVQTETSTEDGGINKITATLSNGQTSEFQVRNGNQGSSIPVGTIVPYAGRTAPTGWLLCNGQAVSKADYSALFAVIGYTYSSTAYQASASSSYPNPNTTHFQVPDLRESVPVGVGTASSAKYWRSSNTTTSATSKTRTQTDSYILGQFKDDALQGHKHELIGYYDATGSTNLDSVGRIYSETYKQTIDSRSMGSITSDGTHGTPRIDSVTRGKRFGVNYIIKY